MSEKVRLYYYMKAEYLEPFLKTYELKLTNLADTNDPFEFFPTLDFADTSVNMPGDYAHMLHVIDCFSRDMPMLVLCLSRLITSPQMWGNYADSHKGICLAFDLPLSEVVLNGEVICGKLPNEIQIAKVHYSKERLAFNKAELGLDGKSLVDMRKLWKAIAYKGECWEHEQECRLIFFADKKKLYTQREGLFFTDALFKFLSGIILGVRCPLSQLYVESIIKDEIKHITKSKGARWNEYASVLKRICEKRVSRAKRAMAAFQVENTGGFVDTPEIMLPVDRDPSR